MMKVFALLLFLALTWPITTKGLIFSLGSSSRFKEPRIVLVAVLDFLFFPL